MAFLTAFALVSMMTNNYDGMSTSEKAQKIVNQVFETADIPNIGKFQSISASYIEMFRDEDYLDGSWHRASSFKDGYVYLVLGRNVTQNDVDELLEDEALPLSKFYASYFFKAIVDKLLSEIDTEITFEELIKMLKQFGDQNLLDVLECLLSPPDLTSKCEYITRYRDDLPFIVDKVKRQDESKIRNDSIEWVQCFINKAIPRQAKDLAEDEWRDFLDSLDHELLHEELNPFLRDQIILNKLIEMIYNIDIIVNKK